MRFIYRQKPSRTALTPNDAYGQLLGDILFANWKSDRIAAMLWTLGGTDFADAQSGVPCR
jgi:hypothetical protein